LVAHGHVHVVASSLSKQNLVQGYGKTSTWQALEIVKFNNASYCHIIAIQGLPRLSLKTQLNFKLKCLQYYIMANDT
jgi:hypothetical protein